MAKPEDPSHIRQICYAVKESVSHRFPDATYTAVGAFIFLRVFCPAIISPETMRVFAPADSFAASKVLSRGLLFATKIIQNLANNVLFGPKELYMVPLNDFLTGNFYRVTSFLRDISNPSVIYEDKTDLDDDIDVSMPMGDDDYIVLHKVLYNGVDRMLRNLARKPHQDHDPRKAHLEKISNLLAQLGRPPEVTVKHLHEYHGVRRPPSLAVQQYNDFMRRYGDRRANDDMLKSIFYTRGVSREGRPIVYFIARKVSTTETNFETLFHYMFKASRVYDQTYTRFLCCSLLRSSRAYRRSHLIC